MSQEHAGFPRVPAKYPPASAGDAASTPRRPVVLVVDDEVLIADSLSEILKRSGYAAIHAYDGESALKAALAMPPDLLISDITLPGMDGFELAIAIRRILPDCKVILSSGQPSTWGLNAAGGAENQFVILTKPVHPKDLLACVAESLVARKLPASVAPPRGPAVSTGSD